MKIPDNFVLLLFAAVLVGISHYILATDPAYAMLQALWGATLIKIQADGAILPSRNPQPKVEAQPPQNPTNP